MSADVTIVCFARSRRPGGLCVAGREYRDGKFGRWIRPISERDDEALTDREASYGTGSRLRLLDVVRVPILRQAPKGYQQENYVVDTSRSLTRIARVSASDALKAMDGGSPLWRDGESSQKGLNNRVALSLTYQLRHSLCLIQPEDLEIVVSPEGGQRAEFKLGQLRYSLDVTDPESERSRQVGRHPLRALLCVSLGSPYYGYAYKLAAGIVPY